MSIQVDAVYQDGVLKLLQPLELAEHERVRVSVTRTSSAPAVSHLDLEYLDRLRMELRDADPAPGLEEVRRRLAAIPGSITADLIAEREDR
jgi:predicted DNA-binding antitoxin AbrB/MazE fold protein